MELIFTSSLGVFAIKTQTLHGGDVLLYEDKEGQMDKPLISRSLSCKMGHC